jgi:NADH dehydrogenase
LGTFVAVGTTFVVAFFIYDATTYGATPSIESLPVSSLALNPRRGGPKNLPIAEYFIDDGDCEHKYASKHKPKLVLLGTGWGSVAVLKNLNPEDYHVTVISPSNQFLFTPMLPSATVGTLELRSLVEPVRGIINRVHGHFLKAMSVDIAFSEKLVEVESVDASGKTQNFYVPYDKLVIGCGEFELFTIIYPTLTSLRRFCDESSWSTGTGERTLPERYSYVRSYPQLNKQGLFPY